MVTGRREFKENSRLSVASAILKKEPSPITAVKPLAPLGLDHAIRKCLSKVPDDRWQSARDLESELKWIVDSRALSGAGTPTPREGVWRQRMSWGLALGAVLIAALFGIACLRQPTAGMRLVRSW